MGEKYDLAVIGGGPGGYVAAVRAMQLGLKVVVIEEKEMGGTCLNRGCIPTKSLLYSSELYHAMKTAEDYGVTAGGPGFDYSRIAARKDEVVKKLRSGVEYLIKKNGGSIIKGRATLVDKNTIEITGNGKILTDKIIIATGSRPVKPAIPGINGEKIFDSDGILALTSCPEKVLIIGGGVIGVELACIFSSLDREVTIFEMMDTVLPGLDKEVSMKMQDLLNDKGVKIFTGAKVTKLISGEKALCIFEDSQGEKEEEGSLAIVAIGRAPNSENMGFEKVGISTQKGFISVNDKLETNIPGIYAIGDVTGKSLLAHVASAQGIVAAANAAGQEKVMAYSIIPGCVYANPEIAFVGLTESEARLRNKKIKIGKFTVSRNGKSMIMGESEGFVKIITDERTEEILGAHIIGPRATDLISEICVAMKLESTIGEIGESIHPHPTVSEMIMEAAHDIEGLCIHK